MPNIDKRLKSSISLLLDLVIGFGAGFWASNTFPESTTGIAIVSAIAAIIKIYIDFFVLSREEEFYHIHIEQVVNRAKYKRDVKKTINDQYIKAVRDNDETKLQTLNDIREKLNLSDEQ